MTQNKRKEIERLWNLCKETNVITNGTKLWNFASFVESDLNVRLSKTVYRKMKADVGCFKTHAQDKRFAEILLKKLDRYCR